MVEDEIQEHDDHEKRLSKYSICCKNTQGGASELSGALGCSPRVLTIRTLRQPNTVTPFINYYNNFSVRKKPRHELPEPIQPQPIYPTEKKRAHRIGIRCSILSMKIQ